MCTLIVLHRCVPGSPLVIAANRDEFLDRPAEGPAVRKRASGSILAPLDLEAGGTWLGVNDRGVFVGLTNLRPAAADAAGLEHAGKRTRDATHASGVASASRILDAGQGMGISGAASRGDVVMAALDAASAVDAVERVARMTRRDAPGNARGETAKYNPFQLLIADAERAWLTVYRDHRAATRTTELEPGVHVVGNVESPRGEGFRIDSPAEVARFDRTAAELPRGKEDRAHRGARAEDSDGAKPGSLRRPGGDLSRARGDRTFRIDLRPCRRSLWHAEFVPARTSRDERAGNVDGAAERASLALRRRAVPVGIRRPKRPARCASCRECVRECVREGL